MYIAAQEGVCLTAGYIDHLSNNVDPCNQLSDRVLHLQSSVHLQEIKISLPVHQKLTGAYTERKQGASQHTKQEKHFVA